MPTNKLETIKNILAIGGGNFDTVTIELYDLIFQRGHNVDDREKIFTCLIEEFNRRDFIERPERYIFTAKLKNQQTSIGGVETYTYIRQLKDIKAQNVGDLSGAAKCIFRLLEEMGEYKFVHFGILFMSGFFPYEENCWSDFEESEAVNLDADSIRAINLINLAGWSIQNNEQLLTNYAVNLIDSFHGNKIAQREALRQLIKCIKSNDIPPDVDGENQPHNDDFSIFTDPVQNQDKGRD